MLSRSPSEQDQAKPSQAAWWKTERVLKPVCLDIIFLVMTAATVHPLAFARFGLEHLTQEGLYSPNERGASGVEGCRLIFLTPEQNETKPNKKPP